MILLRWARIRKSFSRAVLKLVREPVRFFGEVAGDLTRYIVIHIRVPLRFNPCSYSGFVLFRRAIALMKADLAPRRAACIDASGAFSISIVSTAAHEALPSLRKLEIFAAVGSTAPWSLRAVANEMH